IVVSYPKPSPFHFHASSEAAWIYNQRVPPIVREKLEMYYRMLEERGEERSKISRAEKVVELTKELQDLGGLFAKDIPPDIPTGEDVLNRQAEIAWLHRRIGEIIQSNGLQDLATSLRAAPSNPNQGNNDPNWEVLLQGQRLDAINHNDM